ncbi:MAG: YXWGXW repeat-containing protein [Deltaproteobacteria bacterium]|nr:YXWGXW repeat-containing protein [Deltaproteobacteria bacterium]
MRRASLLLAWSRGCASPNLRIAVLMLAAIYPGCVIRERARPAVPGAYGETHNTGDYGTVYPSAPPPQPVSEFRPSPPGYGYIWIDGSWDWTGNDWRWTNGHWTAPRAGYFFVGPRYVFVDGRPVYYRSYWQGSGGYRDYNYGRSQQPPAVLRAPAPQPSDDWRRREAAASRANPPYGSGTWRAPAPAPSRAPSPGVQQPPPGNWGAVPVRPSAAAPSGWRDPNPSAPASPPRPVAPGHLMPGGSMSSRTVTRSPGHVMPGSAPAPAPRPPVGSWQGPPGSARGPHMMPGPSRTGSHVMPSPSRPSTAVPGGVRPAPAPVQPVAPRHGGPPN